MNRAFLLQAVFLSLACFAPVRQTAAQGPLTGYSGQGPASVPLQKSEALRQFEKAISDEGYFTAPEEKDDAPPENRPPEIITEQDSPVPAVPAPEVVAEEIPPLPAAKPAAESVAHPIENLPPLPPRRPAVLNASESFVREARRNFAREQQAEKRKEQAAPHRSSPKPPPALPEDPLGKTLESPSARDILRQIEGGGAPDQEEANVAALPPDITADIRRQRLDSLAGGERLFAVAFAPGDTDVPHRILTQILGNMINMLEKDPALRVRIEAYATDADEGQSSARRISLARAMTLRSYLLDRGLDSGRIDILPLGGETAAQPADRADLIVSPLR